MPFYNCTSCQDPVSLQAEVARGQTVNCPNCGTPIASGQRSYKRDYEAYKNASFVAPRKRARSAYVVVASGRSPAAPVRTVWPGPNLNTDVTHVPNLMSAAWLTAGASKIALAYNDLDLSRPGAMEGLLIDCPEAVGKASVVSHFAVVKTKLVAAHKLTDIAEATGEAAAALCILRETRIGTLTLAGFDMEWGMHVHSGPGIDQIWSRNLGGRNQYLIVEAKGPNQATSPNNFMPPDFDQMSIRWIMHNLGNDEPKSRGRCRDEHPTSVLRTRALSPARRCMRPGEGDEVEAGQLLLQTLLVAGEPAAAVRPDEGTLHHAPAQQPDVVPLRRGRLVPPPGRCRARRPSQQGGPRCRPRHRRRSHLLAVGVLHYIGPLSDRGSVLRVRRRHAERQQSPSVSTARFRFVPRVSL